MSVAALQPSLRISIGARSHGLGMPGSRGIAGDAGRIVNAVVRFGAASARSAGVTIPKDTPSATMNPSGKRQDLHGHGRMAEPLHAL